MATFTQRANGQWQAKVRRQGHTPVSKAFKTKTAAKQWAKAIEVEMDKGAYVSRGESESTTLDKALDRYLKEVTPTKKGAKVETFRIKAWKRHPLAKKYLSNITGSDIAAYRDERLEQGKSATTIRNALYIISDLFNVARKEWGMGGLNNPVTSVRMPKVDKGRDRRLKKGEEKKLMKASEPLKQIIILALETGMRMGEILGMSWDKVNLKRCVVRLEDTKNNESRDVPLSSTAVETLRELKEMPRHINSKVFQVTSVSHKFGELCREQEIEDLRFHDLRHEATSRLFERGLNPMEVSAITGHKTLAMLKRYTHLKAEDLAKRLG